MSGKIGEARSFEEQEYSDDYEEASDHEPSPRGKIKQKISKRVKLLKNRKENRPFTFSTQNDSFSFTSSRLNRPAQEKIKGTSVIQDRIISAKREERHAMLNKIYFLESRVSNLREENRTLTRLIKRQNTELSKLQDVEGELPTLLRAHGQEVRALRTNLKKFQELSRELKKKLREKESQLFKMRDSNRRLKSLSEDRDLEDKESLRSLVEDLKLRLSERDEEVKELMYKLSVKEKNNKQLMTNEANKLKAIKKKYEDLDKENENLRRTLKDKEKQLSHLNIYSLRHRGKSMSNLNGKEDNQVKLSNSNGAVSLLTSTIIDSNQTEIKTKSTTEIDSDRNDEGLKSLRLPEQNVSQNETGMSREQSPEVVIEREKSFSAVQRFFQNSGSLIDYKSYSGKKEIPKNKVELWMPSQSQETPKKPTHSHVILDQRPMYAEKPLDTLKKENLLSQLEEIEEQQQSASSFYSPTISRKAGKLPSNLSSVSSASSRSSSTRNLDNSRSAALMKELFGT